MIRVDQSVVARICNEETGAGMSLGYGALMKLMSAFPFVTRARETLLSEVERSLVDNNDSTPKAGVKRKLVYDEVVDDSPIRASLVPSALPWAGSSSDDSPIRPSQWVPMGNCQDLEVPSRPKKRMVDRCPVYIDLTQDDSQMEF